MTTPHPIATSNPFGILPDGTQATLFTLRNESLEVTLTDYGARLVSLHAPDRTGHQTNVVLGLTAPTPYTAGRNFFMGATAGRYANRIAQGRFTLEGVQVEIPANNGPNALHGGPVGFDARLWKSQIINNAVTFTLISPDGDQGFPGTLIVTVTYTLTGSALHITYTATTDRTTVLNLTNHAYFNLAGESSNRTILDHVLQLNASAFTPVDETIIPTGELAPVAGTPFDFLTPRPIGQRIDEDHPQLARAGGYDHNWVLNGPAHTNTPPLASEPAQLKIAAVLHHPTSGRTLTVHTTEPGIQFYAGNFLNGTLPNRDSTGTYARRTGLCLETQHFPDSPNHPNFPTTTLHPNETFQSTTIFNFTTED